MNEKRIEKNSYSHKKQIESCNCKFHKNKSTRNTGNRTIHLTTFYLETGYCHGRVRIRVGVLVRVSGKGKGKGYGWGQDDVKKFCVVICCEMESRPPEIHHQNKYLKNNRGQDKKYNLGGNVM